MGSAALFFAAEPKEALLADLNEDLVICFQEMARNHQAIIDRLKRMPNRKDFFLAVRKQNPSRMSRVQRAARVIYLNKTCYGGLWRVNRNGEFNAPYGNHERPTYSAKVMAEAGRLLGRATIRHQSFEATLAVTRQSDWVYLDPPYIPAGGYADFNRYTAGQFRIEDHKRLVECCRDLDGRGVPFLLTNTNNVAARRLYSGFRMYELMTKRDIASNAERRPSSDLVVSNYRLSNDAPVIPLQRQRW